MRRVLALLLPCLLALAPLTAGCGEEDVDPDALAEAAEATRGQGGVHMVMDSTIEGGGMPEVALRMEGDVDFVERRMHAKLDGAPLAKAAGVDDRDQFDMEQIVIGTTFYMRMPMLTESLGVDWVKMDLQKVGEAAGLDFSQLMQLGSGDPGQQLEQLHAMSDLEEVGREDVDGVATTHYKGEVDLRRFADVVPEEDREKTRKSMDRLIEMMGRSRYPTEVWIDDDHLIRRQRFSMSMRKPQEMEMDMDVRYSDFGKQVDIRAPKGEIRDMTEVATRSQGQGDLFGP
ncbi:MAG TPA: LppX_LprAFG lipoprotein [Solirubrobacteraceae bacterium]|nr:LppX_LprAFG lipoprotein [Solirubrobacteraceae bacterium]